MEEEEKKWGGGSLNTNCNFSGENFKVEFLKILFP